LAVLTHHPSVVRTLVPFEPPAVRLLADGQEWVDFFFEVYDLYCQSGIEPALETFRERAFPASDRQVMARARERKSGEHIRANATYWFEHELRQYPRVELDFDALAAYADRIVPASGRDGIGYPCHDATIELGARLDRPVIELPGGHVGFLARPATFARDLVHALLRPGDSCAPSPAQPTDKGHPRWSH
jgi:acetyltransferase/esterase